MTAHRQPHQMQPAARGRLLLWCAAIVLVLQLFAATAHDHETSPKSQDCVACAVHAQAHAAPPARGVAPIAFNAILAHLVGIEPLIAPVARDAGWLLPQAHAPPVLLLSH